MDIPRNADAVVIGAGILGASTAHFLAKAGHGEVVLLDKGRVCSGATPYSSGVIRQHYSNPVTIRLALRAMEMFKNSDEELGGPTGFTQCGYLVMAPEGDEDETIRTTVPRQQELGVDTEILSADEIAGLYPELDLAGISIGALERESGYANPTETVNSIVRSAAEKFGLAVHEDTAVTDIDIDSGRVTGVTTTAGSIATPVVVNCAGAWAADVGEMAGIDYSISISREHVAVLEVPEELGKLPLVADHPQRLYFRPDGAGRLHIGRSYPKDQEPCDPDDFDPRADSDVVRQMVDRLVRRVPMLRETLGEGKYKDKVITDFSSVYEITDDWHPFVGPSERIDGYYAAVGGSGHCFKIGPPIGEALADVIVGREPAIDIEPLGQGRLAKDASLASAWGPCSRG